MKSLFLEYRQKNSYCFDQKGKLYSLSQVRNLLDSGEKVEIYNAKPALKLGLDNAYFPEILLILSNDFDVFPQYFSDFKFYSEWFREKLKKTIDRTLYDSETYNKYKILFSTIADMEKYVFGNLMFYRFSASGRLYPLRVDLGKKNESAMCVVLDFNLFHLNLCKVYEVLNPSLCNELIQECLELKERKVDFKNYLYMCFYGNHVDNPRLSNLSRLLKTFEKEQKMTFSKDFVSPVTGRVVKVEENFKTMFLRTMSMLEFEHIWGLLSNLGTVRRFADMVVYDAILFFDKDRFQNFLKHFSESFVKEPKFSIKDIPFSVKVEYRGTQTNK